MAETLLVNWRESNDWWVPPFTSVSYEVGNTSKPMIFLLHGNNGNYQHWREPQVKPGFNIATDYNYQTYKDDGWKVLPPVLPTWLPIPETISVGPNYAVRPWWDALLAAGYGVLTYSQCQPAGLLAKPAEQLEAVFNAFVQKFPNRQIVLLAHSRGGMLSRRFLMNIRNRPERARIQKLLTLHSPHQGSQLANMGNDIGAAIDKILWGPVGLLPPAVAALKWLRGMLVDVSYQEMAIDSPFLRQLAAEERANGGPVVPTYTWGGTKATLIRPASRHFRDSSWWHRRWPGGSWWQYGFHWEQDGGFWPSIADQLREYRAVSPGLIDWLCTAPELNQGDLLTYNPRTSVPGEKQHRVNYLNHAEALWDQNLQSQVLSVLAGAAVAGGRSTAAAGQREAAVPEQNSPARSADAAATAPA